MNKIYLTVLTGIWVCVFSLSTALAAPNIVIDGVMNADEWYESQTDYGYIPDNGNPDSLGGEAYDLEGMGLYINDDVLYFAIQAGYDLQNGQQEFTSRVYPYERDDWVDPGDFAFSFNGGTSWDVGIDYTIDSANKVDLTIHWGNLTWYDTTDDTSGTGPFALNTSSASESIADAGVFSKMWDSGDDHYNYTIEAAVNLNDLSFELQRLFDTGDSDGSVVMHYTMECGNDVLEVTENYSYSETPEPATFLMLGIGLFGFGIIGRRHRNKERKNR